MGTPEGISPPTAAINDLAARVERSWPLSGVQIGKDTRGAGSRGVYRMRSEQGQWVLKLVAAPSAEALAEELRIFDFLRAHGFRFAPRLLHCRDGTTFDAWNGAYAYVLAFVPGRQPRQTPETYARLGSVVGQLHAITGYTRRSYWTTRDIIHDLIHQRAPQLPYRDEYLELARQLRDLDELPDCLIHGDVALSNCVQTAGGELVLIDWGGSLGPRVLDSAYMLLQFLDGALRFDEASARAFYSAYFALQTLSDAELARYFDAAMLLPMNFVLLGRPMEHWRRVQWACTHRQWLMELVESCRR